MLSQCFLAAACAAALSPALVAAQPAPNQAARVAATPLTLDQALELAVRRSESARSARAGIASATQSAQAAGQLPDPMLRVGIDNVPVTGPDRLSTTRDFMTMKRIGISQEWVSADKRAARQAAAQAAVGREQAQLQSQIADARLQTALAFVDAFYAAEALKLTQLMEHHAREEVAAARARLASSNGSGQEVLALTAAWAIAEDDSAEVLQQQAAAEVSLERWIGIDAIEFATLPQLTRPQPDAFVQGHPVVLGKQQDVRVAQLEAAAVATNRRPNWSWEASYGQRTGYSDMLSVGVSIPLPVAPGARQDRDTAAKLALVDKAEAELAEARRGARAEYDTLVSSAQLLEGRIRQYGDSVLLYTQQRVAAATAAYRSNQGTLLTLFEARRGEVDAQRKLLALQREFTRASAQLAFRSSTDLGNAP